jgi:hypothetical protein
MGKALKPYPGRFVHGVNIGDWYPCWNLALAGRLWSPDFAALTDPGLAAAHQPLRDVPIDVLRTTGVPQGVPTPRATWYVWAAAWVRRGGHVGIGTEDTNWLPREDLDRILRLGDIELAFEEARRKLLPESASRLASLYLADDSDRGRAHVRAMLGVDILILRVTIPLALRVSRVDTKWFELYCHDAKAEYIEKYWSSAACDPAAPTWEYLVDGMIEVDDPEGLAHIREFGAHRFLGQKNA